MTIRDARLHSGDAGEAGGPRRRRMTVSEALRWAWSEELPKEPASAFYDPPLAARSAWSAIQEFGALNAIVDRQPNRYGCIPFDRADSPHPDALLLAREVSSLAECVLDLPEGWHPMPEMADVDAALGHKAVGDALHKVATGDGRGGSVFRIRPDMLVIRYAIIGIVPDWRLAELPVRRFEAHVGGVEKWFVRRDLRSVIGTNADGSDRIEIVSTEVDGWSQRLRRPVAGAYRKPYLDPDPVPVMVARAEYQILVAAMTMLHEGLAGTLDTIELLPVDWPDQPWSADSAGERRSRILPDLRADSRGVVVADTAMKSKRKPKLNRVKESS